MAKLFRHHPERWFFCALLTILIVGHGGASAANLPTATQINDTLYRADGSAASGTLLISWPAFTTADKQPVAAGTKTVAIGKTGSISVSLVPTGGAVPSGVLYKIVMKLDDGTSSIEYWNVPGTPTATLATIRTTPATQPSAGVAYQAEMSSKLDRQGDTPVTLAGLRFASKFSGSTAANQIGSAMSACTDPGCVVVIPSDMASGAPVSIPDNVRIIDFRGVNGPDETGSETASWKNNLLFRARWTSTQGPAQGYQVLHLHSEAAAGGVNQWPTGLGYKSTYSGLLDTHVGRTPGQHISHYLLNNNYSDGDTVSLFANAQRWGNTSSNGDEGIEAISGTVSGGDKTLTATITSISESTLYYGSASNEYTRGENRLVINTTPAKVYAAGTVTSIPISGAAVVTLSDSSLATQFGTGSKTNLCFALDADQVNGIKRVFPVASIDSATQVTLDTSVQGSANAGWGYDAPTTGTYKIYKCSTSTSAALTGQMGVADASVFARGDTIEQVLGYGQSMIGAHFALFPTLNSNGLQSMGMYLVNNGQAPNGSSSSKIRLSTGVLIDGPWRRGITIDGDVSEWGVGVYNLKQGSVALAVDDTVLNDQVSLVSAMRNDWSRAYFSYSKATDKFCFGDYTAGLCKFQIKPGDGSATMSQATMSQATITGNATVAGTLSMGMAVPSGAPAGSLAIGGMGYFGTSSIDPELGLNASNLPYSVRAYGAKCDGVSDDTTQIQVAIDAAYSSGKNRVMLCWPGSVVTQIKIHDHTELYGGKLIHKPGTTTPLLVLAENTATNWYVHDAELYGNKTTGTGGSTADGIQIDFGSDGNVHQGKIVNVYIHSFPGIGLNRVRRTGGGGQIMTQVNVRDCGGDGFYLGGDDDYCNQCQAGMNGGVGIHLKGWQQHVLGGSSWMNTGDGYWLDGATGSSISNVKSQDNHGWGFNIAYGSNYFVQGIADTHYSDAAVHIGDGVQYHAVSSSLITVQTMGGAAAPLSITGPSTVGNEIHLTTDSTVLSSAVVGTPDATNIIYTNGQLTNGAVVGSTKPLPVTFATTVSGSGQAQGITDYYAPNSPGGVTSANEIRVRTIAPAAFSVANLNCSVSSPLSAGETVTFTVRSGATSTLADSTLTCQATSGSQTCSDMNAAHAVALSAGYQWDMKAVTSSLTGAEYFTCSVAVY